MKNGLYQFKVQYATKKFISMFPCGIGGGGIYIKGRLDGKGGRLEAGLEKEEANMQQEKRKEGRFTAGEFPIKSFKVNKKNSTFENPSEIRREPHRRDPGAR